MTGSSRGFTIVEVVAALLLLGVGAVAVASGAGAAERMLGRGRHLATAAIIASGRLERLRRAAVASRPPCVDPAFSGGTAVTGDVQEIWSVAPTGAARMVRDLVEYAGHSGTVVDTMSTIIACPR